MNSYINIGNLKTINAELTNYCNAACPMCPRFDFDLNLIKDYTKININHTSLEDILEGEFFNELANGIQGKENAYRLQTCYHTCGVN